jgi:fructokinase
LKLYGGIEAGGTKFVCAAGAGPDHLLEIRKFATENPDQTIGQAIAFFQHIQDKQPLAAIGIGSFGPIDLNLKSPTYGYITTTPKPGWANTDFVGPIRQALGIPVGFDTDVNAAALGEYKWGAGRDLDSLIYLTIGTGIGGGGIVDGKPIHGLVHPEMGHLLIPHDRNEDPFAGVCPFHRDCWEGLASGPALESRWGQPAESLPLDHPAWALEAKYIALALANLTMTLSPQRIILGGGVMDQAQLYPLIRNEVKRLLNDYIKAPGILEKIDQYIVPPALGNRSGVLGAIALAQQAG